MESKRIVYDKSHHVMSCGAIGSLQTLSVVPVVAGDSLDCDLQALVRLSPLARQLYIDAKVDLFAFFIPYRYIYSNWTDFILGGVDEAVTLGTQSVSDDVLCCAHKMDVGTNPQPTWLVYGLPMIFNHYFRDPNDVAGLWALNALAAMSGDNRLKYGIPCCHLPTLWTTGNYNQEISSADYYYTVSGSVVDLLEVAQLQARLRGELGKQYFGARYDELVKHKWGAEVSNDALQKPWLCAHESSWLSSKDVEGTDSSTLGRINGVSAGLASMRMPLRFFPEHGSLWIVALVRFPPIHNNERHYLCSKAEPTYQVMAGDPEVVKSLNPIPLYASEVLYASGYNNIGMIPHSQWYRHHPNSVHYNYSLLLGHPFVRTNPTTPSEARYIPNTAYDDVFSNRDLKHWNLQGHIEMECRSMVPDPVSSIFAGTR